MDSVSSTASSPDPGHSSPDTRLSMTQHVADRIVRALRHRLLLLHRSESDFYVLGATGNVYTVTISLSPSCTCPDRMAPCKHILFVMIRALGVSLDDTCLMRKTLRPCQLSRLISTPTSPDSLARASIREIFHQMFLQSRQITNAPGMTVETNGSACPICLDEMGQTHKLVACGTCHNQIHEECLLTWKRSSRRRSTTCVICRARWRNMPDQETYLNLSAYVIEDDIPEANSLCCD